MGRGTVKIACKLPDIAARAIRNQENQKSRIPSRQDLHQSAVLERGRRLDHLGNPGVDRQVCRYAQY